MLITKDRELLALKRRAPFRILRPEAFERQPGNAA